MTPDEIAQYAINEGILVSRGKTPSQTIKAKLSTDILRRKAESRFKRTGPNTFALRVWHDIAEYRAPRYKKALMDEDIVVFDSDRLRDYFPCNGITNLSIEEGLELIGLTFPMRRSEAETRYDVIQLVSQFLVIYRHKIATHKRTRRLPEARLHGSHSILFGGHLNPDDITPLFGPFDPGGADFIRRELSEEVVIEGGSPTLTLLGSIYDPRTDVSRQHLGILYSVRVPPECRIEIGERGFLQQLSFSTPTDLAGRINEFENWSELVHRELLMAGKIKL